MTAVRYALRANALQLSIACAAIQGSAPVRCGGPVPQNGRQRTACGRGRIRMATSKVGRAVEGQGRCRCGQAGEARSRHEQSRAMALRAPDGPMPQEMVDRVIAVARDVSPDLAKQLEEKRNVAPDDMSQAMRQSARRLVALAVLKERNPGLYAIRVEDVRLQLELRSLGEAYRAAQTAGTPPRRRRRRQIAESEGEGSVDCGRARGAGSADADASHARGPCSEQKRTADGGRADRGVKKASIQERRDVR